MRIARFQRFIASLVSTCLLGSSVLVAPAQALAASCSNAYAAQRGELPHCAVRETANGPYAYPKLMWEELSTHTLSISEAGAAFVPSDGGPSEVDLLGNLAAQALGDEVSSSDVATAVATFPTNVPFVLGRYNPMTSSLVIDVFKLEKTLVPGGAQARMLHTRFGPEHGEFWRAAGAYISPDARRTGALGVNPFAGFSGPDESFAGISLPGAQVAMGHAMRMVQAPVAALAVANTNIRQETKKKSGLLKKKVTVILHGEVRPAWYIAVPAHMGKETESSSVAAFCATDPAETNCPWYEVATSGVLFDQFEGGTLAADLQSWELYRKSKSGLSFVGMVLVGVLLGGLASLAMPAVGGAGAATLGSTTAGGGATVGGLFTYAGAAAGYASTSLAAALSIEAVGWAATGLLAGGNLSSTFNFSGPLNWDVNRGVAGVPELDEMNEKLSGYVNPMMASDISQPGQVSLTGVNVTLRGDCAINQKLSECAGGTSGVVQRADQLLEFDSARFIRDTGGKVLRLDAPGASQ